MSTTSNPKKRLLYDDDYHEPSHHAPSQDDSEDQIFISSPIHDRQSTFTAHFHPAASTFRASPGSQKPASSQSITATVKRCQSHPSFRDASHRMVAWRKKSSQQTLLSTSTSTAQSSSAAIYTLDSDDDGEKYAGKRLERVLTDMSVDGVIVVARWYGGVLLGPVRFTHIETCAKEAIRKWKDSVLAASEEGEGHQPPLAKRSKLDGSDDDDGAAVEIEKAKLASLLGQRDASIAVLRDLLADKTKAQKQELDSSQVSTPPATASPLAKKVDYTEMPLARLRQLDKARDASIAFLLKQLDKVEEEERKARKMEEDTLKMAEGLEREDGEG